MPTLRRYRPSDWESFLALDLETGLLDLTRASAAEREAFETRWPELLKSRSDWSDTGPTMNKSVLYVLEEEPDYAGHIWLAEQADFFTGTKSLFVTTVAIAAKFRGRGWGRLLMEHAVEEARRRGLRSIGLGVAADNVRARELYEKLGFTTRRLSMAKELPA